MTRILAVMLLVIVPFFSLPALALEESKSIRKNTKTAVSVDKNDKASPDSKTKDPDDRLKAEKPERAEDHDHYGKFLIFKALAGGGARR